MRRLTTNESNKLNFQLNRSMRIVFFLLCSVLVSCGNDVRVKPDAKLRLEYPPGNYERMDADCSYSFIKNDLATQNNNIDSLLYDAQKLAYDHILKAESIPEQPYVNPDKEVYGMFYSINGNAASQSHFYVTDSLNHFVSGSLYFKAKPNFDSIYPAVVYLREDIRKLMETIEWKN